MLGARKGAATVELGSLTMRKKNNHPAAPPPVVPVAEGKAPAVAVGPGKVAAEEVWEVRPGGMLVQKRGAEEDEPALESVKPVQTIRVKAKHAGVTHEIYISAEATFGDLRKLVAERAGAHPEDLKVMYKDKKERDPKAFLDMAGVRDRSRVAVLDDPEARARRLIEELRLASLQKASKAVSAVAAEVDKIAPKVAALEASVRKGEKVAEKDVATVTELLMNELLKLDAVVAGGDDVKAQRRAQVKRVQKYVEILDAVTAKNAAIARKSPAAAKKQPAAQPPVPARQPQSQRQSHRQPPQQQQQHQQQQAQPAAQTTRWEMFDLLSSLPTTSSSSSTTTDSSTASSTGGAPLPPPPANRLDWML